MGKNTVQAKQWLESVILNAAIQTPIMVLADRKLKSREIADTLKISEGSVFTILHEHLNMRKLCSKWVPHLLKVDQKQQRVDDSECRLKLYQRNRKDFSMETRYKETNLLWPYFT